MLDYIVGIVLIGAPYVLGFANGGAAQWVPIVLGVAALVYSLLTNYELGVVRVIPMPVHLMLDALSGVVLALSPFVLGFAGFVWVPHVVLGLFEILAAAVTRTEPDLAAANGPQ